MQELKLDDMYQKAYIQAKCTKGLFIHDISNLFHILSNSFELCEILVKEGIRDENIIDYFKLIEEQINRGKKLIRNVKRISELEEHGMPSESIDVFETLNNAVQFIQVAFPKRKIDIKVYSEVKEISVNANELLLDVFENILMNSIIYNKNEIAQIEISMSQMDLSNKHFVKLEFKDNGIGIDDNRKRELLQENHIKSNNSRGMGIGLSVVSKFIALCEGNMWIEDKVIGDPSKGSNFIILIPKAIQQHLCYYAYQKV
ncbi:MAG: sensor histidine kinase [Candidatus Thorarchaeota archaeon]